METIIFLLFIGFCIGVFAFLARGRPKKSFRPGSENLLLPTGSGLINKEEAWEARQLHASEGFTDPKPYTPKSDLKAEAEYDGYSRRDRHHLTQTANVKEEAHVENINPEADSPTSFVAWKAEEDLTANLDLRKGKRSAG